MIDKQTTNAMKITIYFYSVETPFGKSLRTEMRRFHPIQESALGYTFIESKEVELTNIQSI